MCDCMIHGAPHWEHAVHPLLRLRTSSGDTNGNNHAPHGGPWGALDPSNKGCGSSPTLVPSVKLLVRGLKARGDAVVKCIALRRVNATSSKKADPYVIGASTAMYVLYARLAFAWSHLWSMCSHAVQVEDTVASTGVKEHTLEPIYNETFSLYAPPSQLVRHLPMLRARCECAYNPLC